MAERYKSLSQKSELLREDKSEDIESGLPSLAPQETSILTDKVKDLGNYFVI